MASAASSSADVTSSTWQSPYGAPPKAVLARIKSDYRQLAESPISGVVVEPESSDLTLAHVLLTGPEGTPYANGFFYFRVRFPQDYPQNPPTVKLCTTGGGVVRFNPNLYANGKSIMNAAPLHNEPGWEEGTARATLDAVADYTQYVRHETIRVAVLDNVLKADAMPESLRESMLLSFLELKDFYVSTCQAHCHWDGRAFNTPWKAAGTFMFGALAEKIKEAAMRVESGELS